MTYKHENKACHHNLSNYEYEKLIVMLLVRNKASSVFVEIHYSRRYIYWQSLLYTSFIAQSHTWVIIPKKGL